MNFEFDPSVAKIEKCYRNGMLDSAHVTYPFFGHVDINLSLHSVLFNLTDDETDGIIARDIEIRFNDLSGHEKIEAMAAIIEAKKSISIS